MFLSLYNRLLCLLPKAKRMSWEIQSYFYKVLFKQCYENILDQL